MWGIGVVLNGLDILDILDDILDILGYGLDFVGLELDFRFFSELLDIGGLDIRGLVLVIHDGDEDNKGRGFGQWIKREFLI